MNVSKYLALMDKPGNHYRVFSLFWEKPNGLSMMKQLIGNEVLGDSFREYFIQGFEEYFDKRGGLLYVLLNDARIDFLKIGFTRSESVQKRIQSGDSSAIPGSMHEIYSVRCHDVPRVEREIKSVLNAQGLRVPGKHKEYFHISWKELEPLIQQKLKEGDGLFKSFESLLKGV